MTRVLTSSKAKIDNDEVTERRMISLDRSPNLSVMLVRTD